MAQPKICYNTFKIYMHVIYNDTLHAYIKNVKTIFKTMLKTRFRAIDPPILFKNVL